MIITGVLIPGDFGHGGLKVKYKNDYALKNGSVYSYNTFQRIVVRIAVHLILTTNNITH